MIMETRNHQSAPLLDTSMFLFFQNNHCAIPHKGRGNSAFIMLERFTGEKKEQLQANLKDHFPLILMIQGLSEWLVSRTEGKETHTKILS